MGRWLSYSKNSVENGLTNAALKYKYSMKRKNNEAFIKQKSEYY